MPGGPFATLASKDSLSKRCSCKPLLHITWSYKALCLKSNFSLQLYKIFQPLPLAVLVPFLYRQDAEKRVLDILMGVRGWNLYLSWSDVQKNICSIKSKEKRMLNFLIKVSSAFLLSTLFYILLWDDQSRMDTEKIEKRLRRKQSLLYWESPERQLH